MHISTGKPRNDMKSAAPRVLDPVLTEITLTRESHLWVVRDEETGIARQGKTWEEALRCSTIRLRPLR